MTLRCEHRAAGNYMKATFFKDRSPLKMDTNHQLFRTEDPTMTIYPVSVSDRGNYKCEFDEGAESESRALKVEGK